MSLTWTPYCPLLRFPKPARLRCDLCRGYQRQGPCTAPPLISSSTPLPSSCFHRVFNYSHSASRHASVNTGLYQVPAPGIFNTQKVKSERPGRTSRARESGSCAVVSQRPEGNLWDGPRALERLEEAQILGSQTGPRAIKVCDLLCKVLGKIARWVEMFQLSFRKLGWKPAISKRDHDCDEDGEEDSDRRAAFGHEKVEAYEKNEHYHRKLKERVPNYLSPRHPLDKIVVRSSLALHPNALEPVKETVSKKTSRQKCWFK